MGIGESAVLDFMQALWALDHGLQSKSKQMETELDVTGPQRLVIRVIGRAPDITAGRIADMLRLHPSTVTGILQRLESRGRIERRSDPADRRRAMFRLTPSGRVIDGLREGTVEHVVTEVLGGADPATVDAARALLVRLAERLEG
jgi:DNA-binding MarR family transcriptional regulator